MGSREIHSEKAWKTRDLDVFLWILYEQKLGILMFFYGFYMAYHSVGLIPLTLIPSGLGHNMP